MLRSHFLILEFGLYGFDGSVLRACVWCGLGVVVMQECADALLSVS